MTRETWESTFRRLLKAQLDITPEQINFSWQLYASQRYTPEQAIAHLIQINQLLPTQGVLPVKEGTGVDRATPPSALA